MRGSFSEALRREPFWELSYPDIERGENRNVLETIGSRNPPKASAGGSGRIPASLCHSSAGTHRKQACWEGRETGMPTSAISVGSYGFLGIVKNFSSTTGAQECNATMPALL